METYLAVDLGAESGRVIAVWLDRGAARYEELARFAHRPVELPSGLHWNITQIWSDIVSGLRNAVKWAAGRGHEIVSIGVDTWGVDWALVTGRGELLGLPHAYRDPRNPPFYEEALRIVGGERIYRETGIQLMPINSLFSVMAASRLDAELCAAAHRLLFIPDLLHYWLCGTMANERTIASTSQMLDSRTGAWATDLMDALSVPQHFLGATVPAGTRLGTITQAVAQATGLDPSVAIITPGSHDTASAVAAVPAESGSHWCFLSSGTWSLLGCELPSSLANEAARQANFTNEAGIGNTVRFLKNIAGLWLVQECRRQWTTEGNEWDYVTLTRLAGEAQPFRTLIDPAWGPFQTPDEMPRKMVEFARQTSQPIPDSPGAFVRCALESLALAYRMTIETMEGIVAQTFDVIHIVGGGGKNQLLNQIAADCTGRRIVAGPAEATALGNGLVQAMALGRLKGLPGLRESIRVGCDELQVFEPVDRIDPSIVERFVDLTKTMTD
jgi:rhamnulokinase